MTKSSHSLECKEQIALAIFDSYTKSVIRNKGANFYRDHQRKRGLEIVSDNIGRFAGHSYDQYPSEENVIWVNGYACSIQDEGVYNAMLALPDKQLRSLLLHFWLNWSDRDVSRHMHVVDRTVRKWRQQALAHLRCSLMSKGAANHDENA